MQASGYLAPFVYLVGKNVSTRYAMWTWEVVLDWFWLL